MIRRLFIFAVLTVGIVGSANCSSESASDLNARMWRTLQDRQSRGDNFSNFKRLFSHDITHAGYRARPDEASHPEPEINARDAGTHAKTPLLWAIHYYANNSGRQAEEGLDLIRFIIAMHGVDLNKADEDGWTNPLTYAVEVGAKNVLDLLLAAGADPNVGPGPRGSRPALWVAVGNYRTGLVRPLARVSSRQTIADAREYAEGRANGEDQEIIAAIDEEVKAKDAEQKKEAVGKEEAAAPSLDAQMWDAIEHNDWDVFRSLFKFEYIPAVPEAGFKGKYERIGNRAQEPDVNDRKDGNTPLLYVISAARFDNKWAQMLVDFGADVNAEDSDHRYTPLIQAVGTQNFAMARLLIDHGANCNASPRLGRGPALVEAVLNNYVAMAEILAPCSSLTVIDQALAMAHQKNRDTRFAIVLNEARKKLVEAEQKGKEAAAEEENELEPGAPKLEQGPAAPGGLR